MLIYEHKIFLLLLPMWLHFLTICGSSLWDGGNKTEKIVLSELVTASSNFFSLQVQISAHLAPILAHLHVVGGRGVT